MAEPNPWAGFHEALGHFVHEFAFVERFLFLQLVIEAELPMEVAQAIFSDAKIDKAKDTFKRIRASKGLPMPEVLDRAFQQLGIITRARNDMLHYGTEQKDEQTLYVSNRLVAHIEERKREFLISVDILNEMHADIQTIQACFAVHLLTGRAPQPFIDAGFGSAAQAPWRYKPQKPSG